jgi:hypothetical protein
MHLLQRHGERALRGTGTFEGLHGSIPGPVQRTSRDSPIDKRSKDHADQDAGSGQTRACDEGCEEGCEEGCGEGCGEARS